LAAIAGTSTADGAHGQLEEQLIQANLLLEALGNAKTTKNDNSSRFGKFIKITFGKSTKISGASIVSYLLERSRVTHQEEGERNFHIFYQLIKCFPGKDALGLADTADYNYITDNSSSIVDSINEQCEFDATLAALSTLGFSTEEKDLIFAILAAILHLGNVTFKGCERSEVVDMTPVNKAGELLRIPPTEIARAICSPFRVRGTQRVQVDKSPLLASLSRDALCRALYGRLFLWIVHRINETLNVTNENFIGILDITGFENLKLNSFEQLCINYTNERLQQFFNNHMFCLEQEEYANEQIPWTRINFDKDSTETIDVIGKIFNSLEDICAATRRAANPDKDFTSKISNQFKGTKVVGDCEFVLEHYVGAVTYDTQGWVEKNRDTLEADLQTAFCASGSKTLASLFIDFTLNTDAMTDIERVMSAARGANVQSISSSYREQLGSLMNTLQATQPHFIRCIIPNDQKMPHTIDDALVVKQLNCNGVLEGIRISRLGYPNRMRYADFVKRYYIIDDESTKNLSDKRAATEKILLKCVGNGIIDPQRHAYGRTKILFRIRELANIEDERARVVGQIAVTIQALARGYAGRKSYRKLFEKYTAAGVICKSEKVDVSHSLIMAKLLDLEE
jgi:myosin protein heavy chain